MLSFRSLLHNLNVSHRVLEGQQLLLQGLHLLLQLSILVDQVPILGCKLGNLVLQLLIFMLQAVIVGTEGPQLL